jgi:hypothetical protein
MNTAASIAATANITNQTSGHFHLKLSWTESVQSRLHNRKKASRLQVLLKWWTIWDFPTTQLDLCTLVPHPAAWFESLKKVTSNHKT